MVDCSFVNCGDNDGGSKWRIAALSAAGPICLIERLRWLLVVLVILFFCGSVCFIHPRKNGE